MNDSPDKLPDKPSDKPLTKGRGGWRGSDRSLANLKPFQKKEPGSVEKPMENPSPCETEKEEQHRLADMQFVYSHPKSADRTEGQRTCRRWKQEDLKGFMRELFAQANQGTDENYPYRLALDPRRKEPDFSPDAMLSVLIAIEGTNNVWEVLFTDDELEDFRKLARSEGRGLGELFIDVFKRRLPKPPVGWKPGDACEPD